MNNTIFILVQVYLKQRLRINQEFWLHCFTVVKRLSKLMYLAISSLVSLRAEEIVVVDDLADNDLVELVKLVRPRCSQCGAMHQ